MFQILKHNRIYFTLFFLLILSIAILLSLYSKQQLFFMINDSVNTKDLFFKYITHLGDGLFFSLVIIVLAFFKFRYSVLGILCYAIPSLFTQFLKKNIFHEYRPKAFFEGIQTLQLVEGVKVHSFNSFPSGHATSVFAMFTLLAIISTNKKVSYLFFALAFLTSFSRVYLSQHFVLDVYAGAIIGTVLTVLIIYFCDKINWFKKDIFDRRFRFST